MLSAVQEAIMVVMVARRDDIRAQVVATWAPFRSAVAELGDGMVRPTSSGWTAKEMIAHVAFWDEAVVPVVVTMFRGQDLPQGWTFGSGDLGPSDGSWPEADVHYAREAAWARTRSATEVIDRCDRAHTQLMRLIDTLTDDEVADHLQYFQDLGSHYCEHLLEIAPAGA